MASNTPTAPSAGRNAGVGSPLNSGPFADSYASLEAALAQAEKDGDLKQQGSIARELGKIYHQDARNERVTGSQEVATRLFQKADHYFGLSMHHYADASKPAQMYVSFGLKGIALLDAGNPRRGVPVIRECITVLKAKGQETYELDLIILRLLHQRPEAWVHLGRAFKLTRKGRVNAGRRWEVIAAAIGNDVYDLVMERRQPA